MAEQDKLEKEKWGKDKADPAVVKTDPVVAKKEEAKTDVAKPTATDVAKSTVTEAAKPPVTETAKPPVIDTVKPPVTDATKPPATDVIKPPATDVKISSDPIKPTDAAKLPVKEEAKTDVKKEVAVAT